MASGSYGSDLGGAPQPPNPGQRPDGQTPPQRDPAPAGATAVERTAPAWVESTPVPPLVAPRLPGPGDVLGPVDETPPRTKREAWVWLGLAALGFVVGQVCGTVFLIVAAAVTGHVSDVSKLAARAVPPAWVVEAGLLGVWIGFLGAVVIASRSYGTGSIVRDMGLRVKWVDVPLGVAVGLAGQYILLPLLYTPLEHVIPHLASKLSAPAKHLTGGFPGTDLVVIGVLTVVVAPVVEELLFRGVVLRGFLQIFRGAGPVLRTTLAFVSTGIIFGLAHVEPLQLLGLAAFGVVLSAMAYHLRRLGPGIFAHATFNLAAIVAIAHSSGVLR